MFARNKLIFYENNMNLKKYYKLSLAIYFLIVVIISSIIPQNIVASAAPFAGPAKAPFLVNGGDGLAYVRSRCIKNPGGNNSIGWANYPANYDRTAIGNAKMQASGFDQSEIERQVATGIAMIRDKVRARVGVVDMKYVEAMFKDPNYPAWWGDSKGISTNTYSPNSNGYFWGPIEAYAGFDKIVPIDSKHPTGRFYDYVNKVRNDFLTKPWISAMSDPSGNPNRIQELKMINNAIETKASEPGIDMGGATDIIKAIFWHESGWQPGATHQESRKGGNNCVLGVGIQAVMGYIPNSGLQFTIQDPFGKYNFPPSSYDPSTTPINTDETIQGDPYYPVYLTTADLVDEAQQHAINSLLYGNLMFETPALKNALETSQSLPKGFLDKCIIDINKTNTADGGGVLIGCIKSVVNILITIGIIALIIRIAAIQLGFIATSGEGTGGGGPVVATRDAIKDGIFGIILLGMALAIINMFNDNLQIDFLQPANTQTQTQNTNTNTNNNTDCTDPKQPC